MPDQDQISRRAYALWEQEGRPDGRHEDHWYRARQELSGAGEDDLPDLDDGAIEPDGRRATAPAPGKPRTAVRP